MEGKGTGAGLAFCLLQARNQATDAGNREAQLFGDGAHGLGQRYTKTVQGTTAIFHYDKQGHLISESSPSGTVGAEYFYLGDIPVAVFK